MKIFKEVLLPITTSLATFLAVPYAVSRGVVPLFSDSLLWNSVCFRISYMVFVFILLQWALLKMLRNWFVSLHNSIRDDKYLIGRNLENYEDKIASAEPQQEMKAIQASGDVVANDTTTTTTEETGEKELDGGDEETRSEQETVIAASEGEEQEKEKEEETLKEPSQAIDLDVVG